MLSSRLLPLPNLRSFDLEMGKRRPSEPLPSDIRGSLHGALPDAEVDLHGLTEAQALKRVDMLLHTWARREGGFVLRIITGRGRHSDGEAVLLHAVGDRLRDELGGWVVEMARDAGGGGWLVRVGSG